MGRCLQWQIVNSVCVCVFIHEQEEEEGSDEDRPKQQSPRQQPLWLTTPRSLSPEESLHLPSLEMSETPLVSPLDEVKGLQPQIITMATIHEASRYSLCDAACVWTHFCFKQQCEDISVVWGLFVYDGISNI